MRWSALDDALSDDAFPFQLSGQYFDLHVEIGDIGFQQLLLLLLEHLLDAAQRQAVRGQSHELLHHGGQCHRAAASSHPKRGSANGVNNPIKESCLALLARSKHARRFQASYWH